METITLIAPIIGLFGVILTILTGIIGAMVRRRLRQIENQVEELDGRLDGRKEEVKTDHQVVVTWLVNMTDALNRNGFDVEKPDEVDNTINVKEGND